VALLPAVPLSLVVRNLLDRSLAPALDAGLEEALQAGLEESRETLRRRRARLTALVEQVRAAPEATLARLVPPTAPSPHLVLLDAGDRPLGAEDRAAALARWPELAALTGRGAAPPDRVDLWLTARVDPATAGASGDATAAGPVVGIALALPAGTVQRAGRMTDGIGLLRTLRSERGRVLGSFVGPFLIVYGVLLVVALASGGVLARRIVRPLEGLVAGTRRVAAGDLRTPVPAGGPGEVGELVGAFNRMLGRLDAQRRELARLERVAAWRGMARTLAHEVKNPLTPILLAMQQVRDNYRGDDAGYRALLEECHDIVAEEVEDLRRLVRSFGDFARLPRPEPTAGDLAGVLREIERLYDGRAAVAVPESAPAWFDADALRRVLVNLVDNGLAACREADRPELVRVTAELAASTARIAVADTGCGIPPAHRERIFEPDFTTKGEGGMGLGLAICASIVAGHGGTLTVDSEEGQGSTFVLTIPRRPPPGRTDADRAAGGESGDGDAAGPAAAARNDRDEEPS
jgi:signal transduction histidine kinase